MQRATQAPTVGALPPAKSAGKELAVHVRTGANGAAQRAGDAVKGSVSLSKSAVIEPPRRALQPIDSNRLTTATDKPSAAKAPTLAYVSRFSRPPAAVAASVSASLAPRPPATSLTGLKRKQRQLEEIVVAQQQRRASVDPPASVEDDADAADVLRRENLAWLDMMVALLERKYRTYQLPVCVDELEEARMLDEYWARRQSIGKETPPPRPTAQEATVKVEDEDKDARRQQALKRHAQQIQDTSVASSTCCGCKTGCLKMYCVCFSTRGYCHDGCSCDNCKNARAHADLRLEAITNYLTNDPRAFSYASASSTAPSSSSGFLQLLPQKSSTVVLRGCRCKKSKCLKKYCECFQNGLGCSAHCRCVDCANDTSAKEQREKNRSAPPTSVVQVSVTKKPRRNYVQKSVRMRL